MVLTKKKDKEQKKKQAASGDETGSTLFTPLEEMKLMEYCYRFRNGDNTPDWNRIFLSMKKYWGSKRMDRKTLQDTKQHFSTMEAYVQKFETENPSSDVLLPLLQKAYDRVVKCKSQSDRYPLVLVNYVALAKKFYKKQKKVSQSSNSIKYKCWQLVFQKIYHNEGNFNPRGCHTPSNMYKKKRKRQSMVTYQNKKRRKSAKSPPKSSTDPSNDVARYTTKIPPACSSSIPNNLAELQECSTMEQKEMRNKSALSPLLTKLVEEKAHRQKEVVDESFLLDPDDVVPGTTQCSLEPLEEIRKSGISNEDTPTTPVNIFQQEEEEICGAPHFMDEAMELYIQNSMI